MVMHIIKQENESTEPVLCLGGNNKKNSEKRFDQDRSKSCWR